MDIKVFFDTINHEVAACHRQACGEKWAKKYIVRVLVPYNPPTEYMFLNQKRKFTAAKRIMKNIAKFDRKP